MLSLGITFLLPPVYCVADGFNITLGLFLISVKEFEGTSKGEV